MSDSDVMMSRLCCGVCQEGWVHFKQEDLHRSRELDDGDVTRQVSSLIPIDRRTGEATSPTVMQLLKKPSAVVACEAGSHMKPASASASALVESLPDRTVCPIGDNSGSSMDRSQEEMVTEIEMVCSTETVDKGLTCRKGEAAQAAQATTTTQAPAREQSVPLSADSKVLVETKTEKETESRSRRPSQDADHIMRTQAIRDMIQEIDTIKRCRPRTWW